MNGAATTYSDKELTRLYQHGESKEALEAARAAMAQRPTIDHRAYLCAAILVDRGGDAADLAAIEQGIALFEQYRLLTGLDAETILGVRYNLTNGFAALARYHESQGDKEARREAWQKQRDELQVVIHDPLARKTGLLPNALTNFANCLSQLGRKFEALAYYDEVLQLKPGHPIALGCAGQATWDLLGIQPKHNVNILAKCRDYLQCALSNPAKICEEAGPLAGADYQKSLDKVDAMIERAFNEGIEGFEKHMALMSSNHPDYVPSPTLASWIEKKLLLTVNPYPEWCPGNVADDLYFDGLGTGTGDEGIERFTVLSHTLNQIKEEFALSRWLYAQSSLTTELTELSRITRYADTLDYADFGLSSGLLKTSMRLSIDILDKVANFLNRYLELGVRERQVSFASIWYENGNIKRGTPSVKLAPHLAKNGYLRGIQDVAETINVFPAPARDIRHRATHDYIIIENAVRPTVRLGGKVMTMDADTLAKQLLWMAKGVVINLIAFVQRNESLTKEEQGKVTVPIDFEFDMGISDFLADHVVVEDWTPESEG